MSRARVVVDSFYLDALGPVSGLTDSTRIDPDAVGGDFQASWSWAPRAGFSASWLAPGAPVEIREKGLVTWGGLLTEPSVDGSGTWSLAAVGYGSLASDYLAFEAEASPPSGTAGVKTSVNSDNAINYAIANLGLPWVRSGSLVTAGLVLSPDDKDLTLAQLLVLQAKAAGVYLWVDSFGNVSLMTPSTDTDWMTRPQPGYLGTTDENYYSTLYGYYVHAATGTPPVASQWEWVVVEDGASREAFGYKPARVDLTALGVLTAAQGTQHITGRLALTGGRRQFTNGLDLGALDLFAAGGTTAQPLSMYGRAGAGTLLSVPGITDIRTLPSALGVTDLVLGEVRRVHDENRVSVTPVGMVGRDLSSALAAAQAPPEESPAADV